MQVFTSILLLSTKYYAVKHPTSSLKPSKNDLQVSINKIDNNKHQYLSIVAIKEKKI